ncbi:MAG TPA: STAS domain-containing protein [Gaiellaceae bacterium]
MRLVDPPDLQMTIARLAPAAHVATVTGELDAHTAPFLRRRLQPVAERMPESQLIVDLAGVSFLDSTALGVLVGTAKLLQAGGGGLVVASADPRLRRLFELADVQSLVQLETTLAEAVERVVARQYA